MTMEIEVGRITTIDNENGKVIQGKITFKNYDIQNDEVNVDVSIPLDKELSIADVEVQLLEKAKQQLKELVSNF